MNQQMKVCMLCFLTILIMIGCSVSTKLTMTTGTKRPPISPEDVKIYDSANKVPEKYVEIALLTSRADYRHSDLADMYGSMREEAAKIGANGLILGIIQEPQMHEKILNQFLPVPAERTGKATAIFVFSTEKQEENQN